MLPIGPHRKWLCCYVPYDHGKLDLSFVHGRAESVFEMVHISRAEIIEEYNLLRVLEKRVCLFADTFTCVSNCYRK